MDASEFVLKISRLSPLQGITIHFAKDGIAGLPRFYNLLVRNNGVRLSNEHDKAVILAVVQSGDWAGDRNRSFTVWGLSTVENRWLTEIARDIEHIEVGDHGAKALMTGRQARREEAAQKIIGQVLTDELLHEAEGWGLTLGAHLNEVLKEFPLLVFKVLYRDEAVAKVSIDGWSGRINEAGKLYVGPEQIQKLLREKMEAVVDKLTAVA